VKGKNKVVEVKWGDAWVDTVGWLVADNENELILSTDIFHSEEDSKYVNTIMVVPKGMIVEYWEYETELETGVLT
jgi:hypothetical protein